jgi:hypothetical protein
MASFSWIFAKIHEYCFLHLCHDVDIPTVAGIPAVARLSFAVYVCVFPIVFADTHYRLLHMF